jgi:hypothetical protein
MAHKEFLRFGSITVFIAVTILTYGILVADCKAAGWLIYHKPDFEGQILDGETKEPIEGAVVVVLYNKRTIGVGAGTLSSVINIRETLTDKEGRFSIPSYTTLIQPFSWADTANFIIYKPGYVSVGYLYDRDLEGLFSGKMAGMKDQEFEWLHDKSFVFRYRSPNIVELPKPKTREQQIRSLPSIPGPDLTAKKMRKLMEYYNLESERLGLGTMKLK